MFTTFTNAHDIHKCPQHSNHVYTWVLTARMVGTYIQKAGHEPKVEGGRFSWDYSISNFSMRSSPLWGRKRRTVSPWYAHSNPCTHCQSAHMHLHDLNWKEGGLLTILRNSGVYADSDMDKANMLNNYFSNTSMHHCHHCLSVLSPLNTWNCLKKIHLAHLRTWNTWN